MYIKTSRKIYTLKFGLKGLILLQEKSNLLVEDELEFLVYCGLISQHPNITFDEVREIIAENCLDLATPNLLSLWEIRELYTRAVGEIGMTPADFLKSTPEEIELAYEGYLRRKETEANLIKLAMKTVDDDELIRLVEEKGYTVGNLNEREQTFINLGLREGG